MKRYILLLSFIFVCCSVLASTGSGVKLDSILNKKQTENLYVLAKVWGFLKYHHPVVANGKSNFDEELFKMMEPLANAASAERRSELLLSWINGLGDETAYKKAAAWPEKDVLIKPALDWIRDKALLSDVLINKLNSVYEHRNQGTNAYVNLTSDAQNPNFDGEQKYTGMTADDDGLRMLGLFRYWNAVEYFFPSKYLIKENWDDVLREFIPVFAANNTMLDYKLSCLKIINRIHDTHANISGDIELAVYLGTKYPAIKARMIEGKVIVTAVLEVSPGNHEPVKAGDEILAVNGKTVEVWRKEREPILCASNPGAAGRNFASAFLLRGNGDSLDITYNHEGQVISGSLKLYPMKIVNEAAVKKYYEGPTYKLLNDSIGYITLATIKAADLKTIFKTFENTRGIVIDIRNYPSEFMPFAMGQYIKPAASPFVKFTIGDVNNPGMFSFLKFPISNGSKNKDYYKGKIVILVDERTQSQAEYTTMALRTAPNAIVMGSQTAGADGNVSMIHFPGGFGSYISGLGVYYPDGKLTQGIGIVPDIEVKPTQQGIRNGIDELLEKAKEYISANR